VGPFNIELQTKILPLANNVYHLYSDAKLLSELDFVDFHLSLVRPFGLRRLVKPQVNFIMDRSCPFKPLPVDQSCAFFEWGFNWAIAQHAMHYLIINSAVLEKNGQAIILPGVPGAGKSTLCAALAHHGWRLLSDEQALVSINSGEITPLARPICLKNESIDIIKDFCPTAQFGTTVNGTSKGDLSHIKAPIDATSLINQTATPSLIVFPQYAPEVDHSMLTPITQGVAMVELIAHCFNYKALGLNGFTTLSRLVSQCSCFGLRYNELTDALILLDQLHGEVAQCNLS